MKNYPEKKKKNLTKEEKRAIRDDIRRGKEDIYELAEKYGCSTSQVAGLKATM